MPIRNRPLLSTCLILACSSIAYAQPPSAEAMKQIQERMKQYTSVGPHHAELSKLLGKWNVEIAFSGAMLPPQRSQGTAEYFWLIEGRWLGQKIEGRLLGQPYQSFSIIGYDSFTKNHLVTTVGSTSNSLSVLRGLAGEPGQPVTALYGTLDDYISGEIHKPYKTVRRTIDADRHSTEIWEFAADDSGRKVLEFTFTRQK